MKPATPGCTPCSSACSSLRSESRVKKNGPFGPFLSGVELYFELFGFSSLLPAGEDGWVFVALELAWPGLVEPAPAVLAPAEAPPFIISLNSLRLSCPSLFLSALSKSYCAPARPEPLAPPDADDDLSSRLALAPPDALPPLAPAEALPPAELLPLCDVEGFACVSLGFLVSCA